MRCRLRLVRSRGHAWNCVYCVFLWKKKGKPFPIMQANQVDVKKSPRTHATPRQMLESYCFMHWVPRRWLVKCRPWWIHSCWKRIRTCDSTWSMFHLSGSPSPCLFLPETEPKSGLSHQLQQGTATWMSLIWRPWPTWHRSWPWNPMWSARRWRCAPDLSHRCMFLHDSWVLT